MEQLKQSFDDQVKKTRDILIVIVKSHVRQCIIVVHKNGYFCTYVCMYVHMYVYAHTIHMY